MSSPFTVYSKSNGEILRAGRCKDEDVELQANPNDPDEAVLPLDSQGKDVTHIINVDTERLNKSPASRTNRIKADEEAHYEAVAEANPLRGEILARQALNKS